MSEVMEPSTPSTPTEADLMTEVQRVLALSPEPLTVSKLRAKLAAPYRQMGQEELTEILQRQAAAHALHQYPRYRSQHDRFWDRPMAVHVIALLREALETEALAWPQIKRKLPEYALPHVEAALNDQLARASLYRHPPLSARKGERFGVRPPDPREFLLQELPALFQKLEQMGFTREQLRGAALELLHEEEWPAPANAAAKAPEPAAEVSPATPEPHAATVAHGSEKLHP